MAMPRSISLGLEKVGFHSNRLIADSIAAHFRVATHNLESLRRLPRLGLPFVPQTSFALSASAIRIVLNDLVLHDRRHVVELGTGISTLYFSKILAARNDGSQLVTVDHDAAWLGRVGEMLQQIGTLASVRLVHAPLESRGDFGDTPWYAHGPIERALADDRVDAVIVDGPKAHGKNDSETRAPALSLLAPRLNPAGAAIFLDDIKRPGERRIYESWGQNFALDRVPDAEFCGLGILVPRGRPLKFKIV